MRRVAKPGQVVGEIGVLCFRPQVFTIHTEKLSQLLRVDRISFMNIVQANVVDGQIIMDNLFQHMKESNSGRIMDLAKEIEQMLLLGKGSITMSLRYAASVGNREMMLQLLKQGMDPNTADHSGRTPLHIAAANGHVECVRVLLDHGADPNIQDNEHNVPLWEAIQAGHGLVARLLWENKAALNSETEVEVLNEIGGEHDTEVTQLAMDSNSTEGNVVYLSRTSTVGSPICLTTRVSLEKLESLLNASNKNLETHSKSNIMQHEGEKWLIRKPVANSPQGKHFNLDLKQTKQKKLSEKASAKAATAMNFENSLFRVVSAPLQLHENGSLSHPRRVTIFKHLHTRRAQTMGGKLILLPKSFEELMNVAGKKLEIKPYKIFNTDGAEIDDINVIRDNDHLYFATEEGCLGHLTSPANKQ